MRINARRFTVGRGLTVAVVAAGVLAVGGAATAFADHDGAPGNGHATPVTATEAAAAALKAVPGGTVEEVELDDGAVWEVDVIAKNGVEHEVTLDAKTGKILASTIDHDDDDDD
ncbi:hypothetical protein GCM10022254_52190 [Actinomadura meridiana]|uniref:PepSY domain-containing protein n=1 Tax=Actinomadura meridiana TaxID=559626 RepID=A0ABP8CDS0_9ACTN